MPGGKEQDGYHSIVSFPDPHTAVADGLHLHCDAYQAGDETNHREG